MTRTEQFNKVSTPAPAPAPARTGTPRALASRCCSCACCVATTCPSCAPQRAPCRGCWPPATRRACCPSWTRVRRLEWHLVQCYTYLMNTREHACTSTRKHAHPQTHLHTHPAGESSELMHQCYTYLTYGTGPSLAPGESVPAAAKPEPHDLRLPLRDARRWGLCGVLWARLGLVC